MIVVSINVHEKPEYLLQQISNIKQHLKIDNVVLLNCNKFMFDYFSKKDKNDFLINPEHIEKRKFHGSLTEGIVSNMKFAMENLDFSHFLVMSSREFFYRELNDINQIKKLIKTTTPLPRRVLENISRDGDDDTRIVNGGWLTKSKNYFMDYWHWPCMRRTKLYQHIQKNNLYLDCSPHEGVVFSRESCAGILNFLENHEEITQDIFNFPGCMEEFALQAICTNLADHNVYYYIGNGVCQIGLDECDENKFTHKLGRC